MFGNRIVAVILLGAVWAPAVGCASLVAGGPDHVPVNSTPPAALVKLDGVAVGKTPLIVPIGRTSEGILTFELEGYQTLTLDLDKVANGWFFGNLLWFPVWPVVPVGMIVDLAASNQGKYSTNPIHVQLKPVAAPALGSRP